MFFQEKKGKAEVIIYDMAQKIIYSAKVSDDIVNEISSGEEDVKNIKEKISKLLDQGYKPQFDEIRKRIFVVSPTKHEVDYSVIKKSIDNAIAFMEPQVSFEPSECSEVTCPISHVLLKDPVVDSHGHTFEKEAIESWLKLNNNCPLQPEYPLSLSDLKPNYFASQTMERLRKTQFAVPSRNLFEGGNEKLAKTLLDQGFVFEEEGKFDEALDFYRKALKYTNKAKDYLYIPVIFERMGEKQSASLAYLYLAKYQIEENNYELALESLIKARDLQSHIIELNNPIAIFYKETNKEDVAYSLFIEIGDRFAKSSKKIAAMSAIEAYKNAISVNPNFSEVYEKLADQIQEKQQKANIYLTAANHFMKSNPPLAEKLAMRAYKIFPENPLNYFPYVQVLKNQKKIDELVEAYLNLSNVFKNLKDNKNKLICLREIVELKPSGQVYDRITKNFLKMKKNKKCLQYFLKWIDFNISENKWNLAETIVQQALQHFKENIQILEKLEIIYGKFLKEHLPRVLFRLANAYVREKDLDKANNTFMKIWEKFHNGAAYFESAKIYISKGNYKEAVSVLFKLAKYCFYKENIALLNRCILTILEINNDLSLLSEDQQLTFLTFSQIGKLNSQVQELTKRLDHSECKDIYKSCAIGDIAHIKDMINRINDPDEIKKIIKKPNEEGLNLLHIAVINNELEIAKLLIMSLKGEVSQPIDPRSEHELAGLSPIDIAAKNGNYALVLLLLKEVGNMMVLGKKNPLHFAAENGRFSIVVLLLSFKVSSNIKEPKENNTALHLAVFKRKLGIAKLLLSTKDIDPNLPDSKRHNPLFYAVKDTLPDFVRVICESNKMKLSPDDIEALMKLNKGKLKEDNKDKIEEIEDILGEAGKNTKVVKDTSKGKLEEGEDSDSEI